MPVPANQNCTNELPAPPDHDALELDAPELVAPGLGCAVAGGAADGEAELDDEAWLASVPVVESDPEREAERRRKLLEVEPKAARQMMARGPLRSVEQYLVAADPVAYEEWFARQPKPERSRAKCLTAADAAAVEWVTRHNPPWIRGQYLGYYRPPVPAHLFLPGAKGDEPPSSAPAPNGRADDATPRPAGAGRPPARPRPAPAGRGARPRRGDLRRADGPTGRTIAAPSTSGCCAWR